MEQHRASRCSNPMAQHSTPLRSMRSSKPNSSPEPSIASRFPSASTPAFASLTTSARPIHGIINRLAPNGGFAQRPIGTVFGRNSLYDKPPVATYIPVAEYSEQARKVKYQGVAILSVLVTEDGLPTDVQVTRSLGMGLDEKAVECVMKYRFRPATKDGAPVAARIAIEVNFRLY